MRKNIILLICAVILTISILYLFPGPKVELIAVPVSGEAPLDVELRVKISANRLWSFKFHCLNRDFNFGDGSSIISNPLCVSYNPLKSFIPVNISFSFNHTYKEPGEYMAEYSAGGFNRSVKVYAK